MGQIKSLQNHCLDLKFARPMKNMVAQRMVKIAHAEGLAVDQVRTTFHTAGLSGLVFHD